MCNHMRLCAICYHLYNVKNLKNTHRTPIAECSFEASCNFIKITLLDGCFSRFLNCANGNKLGSASYVKEHYKKSP